MMAIFIRLSRLVRLNQHGLSGWIFPHIEQVWVEIIAALGGRPSIRCTLSLMSMVASYESFKGTMDIVVVLYCIKLLCVCLACGWMPWRVCLTCEIAWLSLPWLCRALGRIMLFMNTMMRQSVLLFTHVWLFYYWVHFVCWISIDIRVLNTHPNMVTKMWRVRYSRMSHNTNPNQQTHRPQTQE